MASASSSPRKSCSFPGIVVTCLNFTLLLLSLSSVAPILLLRNPPTPLGLAFLSISLLSLLSSLSGLCSCLSLSYFTALVSSSLMGQFLSVVVLFARERQSLSSLDSPRDPREAKALARLECGVFVAMIPIQIMVLVMTCALQRFWVREFEGFEADKAAAMSRKRNRRVVAAATVEEGIVSSDLKAMEIEEETKGKNVKWVKTDFEG